MRCIVVAAAVIAPACTGQIDDGGITTADAGAVSNPHTLDQVDIQMLGVAQQITTFARINQAPYNSAVGTFEIDVSVSQDARAYRQIHPETTGSGVTLPPGTLIARQVLDASGNVTQWTLIGKGPGGYDSTLGDWWFGVTDPNGVPINGTSGPQVGKLTECHGCHLPRAADDFLFGVPQQDQSQR